MKSSEEKRQTRQLLIGGGIVGAVLTLVVSVLMDFLYSDALQGTWRDAIVHDMDLYFQIQLEPNSFPVYVIFALVFFFLSLIGAVIGMVFMIILHKFLKILTT